MYTYTEHQTQVRHHIKLAEIHCEYYIRLISGLVWDSLAARVCVCVKVTCQPQDMRDVLSSHQGQSSATSLQTPADGTAPHIHTHRHTRTEPQTYRQTVNTDTYTILTTDMHISRYGSDWGSLWTLHTPRFTNNSQMIMTTMTIINWSSSQTLTNLPAHVS